MLKWVYLFQLFMFPMILSYADINTFPRVEVNGVVLNKETGTPVQRAFVYIIKGEDEAVTNSRGEFHIVTWANTPFKVIVNHKDFKSREITCNSVQKNITIFLEGK